MKDSKIAWTHHTWNIWLGCEKVSPGCANCYAESWAKRSGLVKWGPNAKRRVTSDATWNRIWEWNKQNAGKPRQRVFVNSLSDIFDVKAPQAWREMAFKNMEQCSNLNFLLLTKRIQSAPHCLPKSWIQNGAPENVWLGVTAENQDLYEERWPGLMTIGDFLNFKVIFLSCEPLLGFIELDPLPHRSPDWIIVGGESGGKERRPMDSEWALDLKDQCDTYGIPFFFKQNGGEPRTKGGIKLNGEIIQEFPRKAVVA